MHAAREWVEVVPTSPSVVVAKDATRRFNSKTQVVGTFRELCEVAVARSLGGQLRFLRTGSSRKASAHTQRR